MTISRRDFLKASGLMAAWSALAACTPNTQTASPQPVLDPTQIALPSPVAVPDSEKRLIHTLRRMTFGPTPEMFDQARRLGLDAFIEEQLFPESISDPGIDSLLQPFFHAAYDCWGETRAQREQHISKRVDRVHNSASVAQPASGVRDDGGFLGQSF